MRNTLIAYLVIIIVFFLATNLGISEWLHPQKWIILSFFGAMSYLYHLLLENGMKNNREKFIEFNLTTIAARMILSLLFIGTLLYLKVEKPKLFVGNFFALYLFFTLFEIINLVRKLRRFS